MEEEYAFRSTHRMLTDNDYWNDIDSVDDWVFLTCAVLCVVSAGLASGLTMGLLSIDRLKLQVKMQTGTKEERKQAEIIMPLIQAENHHYLLVTLLVFNALAVSFCFLPPGCKSIVVYINFKFTPTPLITLEID